ncbi:MAG: ABC transporter ATP-binding protein [Bacillota bacterium]
METLFKAEKLSKSYFAKTALKNVNLTLEKGKILGLLGPNGSGKTTLMKIAAGLLKQNAGEIRISGHTPGVITKSMVSYLPDTNHLYKWMSIKDAIAFYDDFYEDFDKAKARELLGFMKLSEISKVASLSKGESEKLILTLILSRQARLYIFDEPLGGIDPVAREKIIDAILNNYREDSSMIVSTHLVKDVERLFDEVAFISQGEIVLQGNAEELRIERGKSIDELYREVFQ